MTYEQITYDVADGIATITLSRPDKMNAFTGQMMAEMMSAFDATDADDEVNVTDEEIAEAIGPLTVTMSAAKMHAPEAKAPRTARDSTFRCLREASDDGAT